MDNEVEFERVKCNLCGSDEFDLFLEREDLNVYLPGTFTLVRCRICGLVYQNPRPVKESYDLIYPQEYDQFTPSIEAVEPMQRFFRGYGLKKRVKFVARYKKGGTLCDIGCAGGDFLEMAKNYGYQVTGVEPNLQASTYARSLGLNVITGALDEIEVSDNFFDVITMWNVIEHLSDPRAALDKLFHLLKPDGFLIFTTPNLSSFDAKLFGRYWIGFELPRHFYVFSTETIQMILLSSRYNLIETCFFYGSHAAFMSSLRFWLRGKYRVRHPQFENLFFSFPSRMIMMPVFFILDHLKLSSPMTVVCRKKQA